MEKTSTGIILRGYIQQLAKHGIELGNDIWLAGGACRRAVCGHDILEGDFDIYVADEAELVKVLRPFNRCNLRNNGSKKSADLSLQNNFKVQVHCGYGNTLEAVLKTFDFTCCQLGCDGKNIFYIPPALSDAQEMKLVFTGQMGTATANRLARFQKMGFKAAKGTSDAITSAVTKNPSNFDWAKIKEASGSFGKS